MAHATLSPRQPSDKRAEAARINGAKSRGPVTEEGKARSSRNATRHGLLAQTIPLAEELPEAFTQFVAEIVAAFQPRNPAELAFVHDMAEAKWRAIRAAGLHKTFTDRAMAALDPALGRGPDRCIVALTSPEAHAAQILDRYENSFERQYHRAFSRLRALQSRPAPPAPAGDLPTHSYTGTWRDSPHNQASAKTPHNETNPTTV